jgi:hypothetical protein
MFLIDDQELRSYVLGVLISFIASVSSGTRNFSTFVQTTAIGGKRR